MQVPERRAFLRETVLVTQDKALPAYQRTHSTAARVSMHILTYTTGLCHQIAARIVAMGD